jgi:hypothetical protein
LKDETSGFPRADFLSRLKGDTFGFELLVIDPLRRCLTIRHLVEDDGVVIPPTMVAKDNR